MPWSSEPSLAFASQFFATQALAAAVGGDCAKGGRSYSSPAPAQVRGFNTPPTTLAPNPYIGNGTFQTPDIIVLDSSGNSVPIAGSPGNAWNTLLLPNTCYGIQAVVHNDSPVAAENTVVRFWHFPEGVETAGVPIDVQTVTVPANGSIVVASANPFRSGPSGQHECVAASIANPQSRYFNVDPATAAEVMEPTVAYPAGSGHFGSAWRNTNSMVLGAGAWKLPLQTSIALAQPARVKISVAVSKVPTGWQSAEEVTKVRRLQGAGGDVRLPLLLIPPVRSQLPKADLNLKVQVANTHADDKLVCFPTRIEHHTIINPDQKTLVTVSGNVPADANAGDLFLLDVSAHYPGKAGAREIVVNYLEVIYVKR